MISSGFSKKYRENTRLVSILAGAFFQAREDLRRGCSMVGAKVYEFPLSLPRLGRLESCARWSDSVRNPLKGSTGTLP